MTASSRFRSLVRDYGAVVAITVLATALRLWRLDAQSLWGDEMNMIRFATGEREMGLSFGNALAYVQLLRVMTWVGGTDLLYRLPAAIAGALTVPVLYCTVATLLDRRVALLGAALLAVAPMHLAMSQEVHSYALFGLLALVAFLFLWRGLNGGRMRDWLCFAVVLGVGFHVHLFAAFVLLNSCATIALFAVPRIGGGVALRRILADRRTLLTVAVVAVLVAPLLVDAVVPLSIDVVKRVRGLQPSVPYLQAPARWQLSPEVLLRGLSQVLVWQTDRTGILLGLVVAFLLGCGFLLHRYRVQGVTLLLWVLLPPVPILLFSWASNLRFAPRRMIFLLPMGLVVVACGVLVAGEMLRSLVARTTGRRVSAAIADAILVFVMVGVGATTVVRDYYFILEKPDYRSAARLLERHADSGDVVYAWKPEHYLYYFSRGEEVGLVGLGMRVRLDRVQLRSSESGRMWYLRETWIPNRSPNLQALETWLEEQGALTFRLSKHLVVSFADSSPQSGAARFAEHEAILKTALELRPGAPTVEHALVRLRRQAGSGRE